MNPTLKQYLPALGSVVVVLVTVLAGALTDERITIAETVVIIIATLSAFTTYVIPRTTEWPWLKIVVTALLAAVNALQGYLTDGLKPSELLLVVVAGLGAIGVVGATSRFAPLHAATAGVSFTTTSGTYTTASLPRGTATYGTDVKDERGEVPSNLIWTVVGVLLIIALVIFIF